MKPNAAVRNITLDTRFGILTVVGPCENEPITGRASYTCRCECGFEKAIRASRLLDGSQKSCGCARGKSPEDRSRNISIGDVFGRLTVIGPIQMIEAGETGPRSGYACRCVCGDERVYVAKRLLNGNTRSCGCLKLDLTRERLTTHGQSRTRLHNIWCGMKARCYNPKEVAYQYYGAVGITICDEWRDDFVAFRKWAIFSGYRAPLTIERIARTLQERPGFFMPSGMG